MIGCLDKQKRGGVGLGKKSKQLRVVEDLNNMLRVYVCLFLLLFALCVVNAQQCVNIQANFTEVNVSTDPSGPSYAYRITQPFSGKSGDAIYYFTAMSLFEGIEGSNGQIPKISNSEVLFSNVSWVMTNFSTKNSI